MTGVQTCALPILLLANQQKAAEQLNAQQQSSQSQMTTMLTIMMAMMSESSKTMASMVAALAGSKTEPARDESFLRLLLPALIQQQNAGNPMNQFLETVKVVKEITAGTPNAPAPEEVPMLEKLLPKGIEVAGQLASAFLTRNQPQHHHHAPAPTPVQVTNPQAQQAATLAQPAADGIPPEVKAKVDTLMMQLRMVTPILIKAANRNADIDSYLNTLDDLIDDAEHQILVEALRDPNWIATLFGNHPQVLANREWFTNFRDTIIHEHDHPETDASSPDSAAAPAEGQAVSGTPGRPL